MEAVELEKEIASELC